MFIQATFERVRINIGGRQTSLSYSSISLLVAILWHPLTMLVWVERIVAVLSFHVRSYFISFTCFTTIEVSKTRAHTCVYVRVSRAHGLAVTLTRSWNRGFISWSEWCALLVSKTVHPTLLCDWFDTRRVVQRTSFPGNVNLMEAASKCIASTFDRYK